MLIGKQPLLKRAGAGSQEVFCWCCEELGCLELLLLQVSILERHQSLSAWLYTQGKSLPRLGPCVCMKDAVSEELPFAQLCMVTPCVLVGDSSPQ